MQPFSASLNCTFFRILAANSNFVLSRLNLKVGERMPEVGPEVGQRMNLERPLLPLTKARPRRTGLSGTMARNQPPKTQTQLMVQPKRAGLLSPIKNNPGKRKWQQRSNQLPFPVPMLSQFQLKDFAKQLSCTISILKMRMN